MRKDILILLTVAVATLSACSKNRNPEKAAYDPNDPGYEYVPEGDMYYSVPYDPMTQIHGDNSNPYNKDSVNMRQPAAGTVARGRLAYYYPYANNNEGYEKAGAELVNPVPFSVETIAAGKLLYNTYCWQCHGTESGKGSLVQAGKYPPPTWEVDRIGLIKTLSDGKMYHSITYGRNLMGPHAHIVSPQERWMIINYIKFLAQSGATAPAAADTTAQTSADTTQTAQQ